MNQRNSGPLHEPYKKLKKSAELNLRGKETSIQLLNLIQVSLEFLRDECEIIDVKSKVEGKNYGSFVRKNTNLLSRPVNLELFENNVGQIVKNWTKWINGDREVMKSPSLSYTMVTAYCVASDLFDRNNKKGPATYFENFVGHLFAREFDVNPIKKATIPITGQSVRLTMDFLFDLGKKKPKIHLPVKMSTRERVVQAWAHQRLLDAAFGNGVYKGILVVHSETKLDLVNRDVVEICVPDQWLAYQSLLAKMHRIYYFDIPERYSKLTKEHPEIQLKHFSEFFTEKDVILL